MALFQQSVLDKYIKNLDAAAVQQAWTVFTSCFHNPTKQQNIRDLNEEQYQSGFLSDLFVNVLGYTLNPDVDYNLTTEYKNVKDAKKADGAVIIKGEPVCVIELKGTDTTDIGGKVETQAFGYKNNHHKVVYIVTSNFEKLRFYIENAVDYFEFNLFALTFEEFRLLYLCLAYSHIAANLPKKIKDESLTQEDKVTKQLYADYAAFKTALFDNIRTNNPTFDALVLYKSTQKLLDRLLFIFFAEDRNLLPPNSIRRIIAQWQKLAELDEPTPLYSRLVKYFGYMNTGFKGKEHDIFAYNGGLFLPDAVLDTITIDDEVLHTYTIKLSDYNYQTEVDVNILGHIFENSLNDLDEVKATLEGREVDKSKTKRKKDGVFYTPKYITKYIVDNTVGRLCAEKKTELQLVEEDYTADKKRNANTKKALDAKLENYRQWLLQITIVDPACGSGAFLNQALDFLITEHRYIDELRAKLFGYGMVLTDVENSILENNLFGVDINEESVDIAKLSLWLRTAQPRRKLNNLNNNIKCGNSLIDDPAVAGDKAFNWQTEFADVFARGGFDVVIGNPPYGAKQNVFTYGTGDTYLEFYFRGIELIKNKGLLGFITPDSWQINDNAGVVRNHFAQSGMLYEVNDVYKVFDDAPDVWCNCVFFEKGVYSGKTVIKRDFPFDLPMFQFETDWERFRIRESDRWFLFINDNLKPFFDKLNKNRFSSNSIDVNRGFSPTPNAKNVTANYTKRQVVGGEDFGRYTQKIIPKYLIDEYTKSFDSIKKVMDNPFISIQRIRTNNTAFRSKWIIASLFESGYVPNDSLSYITVKDDKFNVKYLLTLLNSTLINFFYKLHYTDKNVKPIFLKELPVQEIIPSAQEPFIAKADEMLRVNKELQEASGRFTRNLVREFGLATLPGKLQNWHTLTYPEFLKELSKLKVTLSLSQKADWEEYFIEEQKQAQALQQQINATDKEIDKLVYELYELTPEEIAIVEGN